MKKILLIAEVYPSPHGTGNETPICHYFAKEWTSMGYEVRVIHTNYILPRIYQCVGKVLELFYRKNNWSFNFINSTRKVENYTVDTIPVNYIPIVRPIPRYRVPDWNNQIAYKRVIKILKKENFTPDVIIGHWTSPLFFITKLKLLFPYAKTGLVLHQNIGYSIKIRNEFEKLDAIGFRNNTIRKSYESLYGLHNNEFICCSGVPNVYLANKPKTFSSSITRFVFVGKLIELKRVKNSIVALNRAYQGKEFHFDIVGDGVCSEELKELSIDLGLNGKITFYGNVSRDKAQEIVGNAECFIMVSDHEAFGLVYLEAMAKGLITIATKGQGADGFIIDGDNGFLCAPKDVDALYELLIRIKKMSVDDLNIMSRKALTTAREMTDQKVAEKYINAVLN